MRILSWNVLWNDGAAAADICCLVDQHRPDLVLLQEATAKIDALPKALGGTYVRKHMERRRHGLAAWSACPFTTEVSQLPVATRLDFPVAVVRLVAPRLALVVRLNGIEVANVHLDHGQFANRRQLRHLADKHPRLVAMIGDYNALGELRLPAFVDVGPRGATHRAYGIVPLRLDRCLVRGFRCSRAIALDFGHSDHRPILVELEPVLPGA